ncbi:10531_t:CDS:2 [Gigaspora margarita]|uniref:10531_t:CDS:1 n=1 Tax=Gigaspora margarita TaxID=4874 RepID=A0ABN7V5D6_GIGMA|nr:10531_t:CDS:2 [Gigaspora margarita]
MVVSDPTKPIYTGHKNIEEFLLYFEAYAALKDWDNGKKSLVIVLYMADKLKPSMIQLMKVHSTWNNLKAAMIMKWATSSDINKKLEYLKNMIQETDDTVQMYTNCFDAYIDESPVKIITEKANRVGKEKVDESPTAQEAIKICCVRDQHSLNTERLDRMETSIVELLKAVQTLGHMAHNCLNRSEQSLDMDQPNTNPNTQINNPNIRDANVRLFKVIKKAKLKEDEYLMIYVNKDEALFNKGILVKDIDQV